MTCDDESKQSYHRQNYPQTLKVLSKHVDSLTQSLNELAVFSWQTDLSRHPRLPLLSRHNEFIWDTFELVRQYLDSLS
jgi:hypothetical protein